MQNVKINNTTDLMLKLKIQKTEFLVIINLPSALMIVPLKETETLNYCTFSVLGTGHTSATFTLCVVN